MKNNSRTKKKTAKLRFMIGLLHETVLNRLPLANKTKMKTMRNARVHF